jgi:cytochrome b561
MNRADSRKKLFPCGIRRVMLLMILSAICALTLAAPVWAEDGLPAAQEVLKLDEILNFDSEGAGKNSERLPYNMGSIASAAIILLSLAAALLLNAPSPWQRVTGSYLVAALSLSVASVIAWLASQHVFDVTRPPLLPTDSLKPGMMIVLGFFFAGAGLIILLIAYRQAQRKTKLSALPLGAENESDRYGSVTRALHWMTAILILILIPMGVFTSMIPEDIWYRQGYYVAHKTIGLTVLILVFGRLVWHWLSPKPRQDEHLKSWEKKSAHAAHILLYLLMLGFPITGYIMSTYAGKLSHFFIWDLPMLVEPSKELIFPWVLAHKIALPVLFYVVFIAHVGGVIKHRYIDRSVSTLRRMLG